MTKAPCLMKSLLEKSNEKALVRMAVGKEKYGSNIHTYGSNWFSVLQYALANLQLYRSPGIVVPKGMPYLPRSLYSNSFCTQQNCHLNRRKEVY